MVIDAKIFNNEPKTRLALIAAYKLHFGGVEGIHEVFELTRKQLRSKATKKGVLTLFKALRFGKEDVDMQELYRKLGVQVSIITDDYSGRNDNSFTQSQVEACQIKDGCYLVPGKKKPLRKVYMTQVPQHYQWREDFASAGIAIV